MFASVAAPQEDLPKPSEAATIESALAESAAAYDENLTPRSVAEKQENLGLVSDL
jgi:hypothetical protein